MCSASSPRGSSQIDKQQARYNLYQAQALEGLDKDDEAAKAFDPAAVGLGRYLARDVTMQPGQSMGAYWITTRLGGVEHPEDSGDTRS